MQKSKNQKTDIVAWLSMALLLFIVFIIIIFHINKQKEQEALEKLKLGLISRKETLVALKQNTDRKVMILYNIFKFGVFTIFIATCILLHLVQHENFIQYISNCLTFFGGIGLITLMMAFLIEENPLDIFKLRSIMKSKIFNLLFQPIQEKIDEIPLIEDSIQATDNLLANLNRNEEL